MSLTAFALSPSQRWLGNDGNWSTFPIQVGNPPATLFLLPATSKRSTWVVHAQGCTVNDVSDCADERGGVFAEYKSTSWKNVTNSKIPNSEYWYLNFATEAALTPLLPSTPQKLNYTDASSVVGTDTLTFSLSGLTAPVLNDALIAAYPAKVPFLGQLGLASYPETVDSYTDIHTSVVSALNASGAIANTAWGYTAGARYRNAPGSLAFGGYDEYRGNVNGVVTIPLQEDTDRDIVLEVRKIAMNDSQSSEVTQSMSIFIDSTVPELWLPESACTVFEQAFGLVWNDTVSMYLVNESQHDNLLRENVGATFTVGAPGGKGATTDITFPYAAFDVAAGYPLLQNLTNDTSTSLRYFPLKRADNDNSTQYYLGRTFLQEAYLAVDYSTPQFNISPATFPNNQSASIVTLYASGSGHKKSSGLSAGAIAGIVVGALAALALAIALTWWFCVGRKKSKSRSRKSMGTSSIGGTTIDAWMNEQASHGHAEHYKPGMSEIGGEEQDVFKPELDATTTARGVSGFHRHELSAGTIRRASDQSRASISPLEERRRGHNRNSSYGVPSPPSADQVGMPSPNLAGTPGHPSPPMSESMGAFGGPVPMQYFELHGRSRDSPASPSTPAPAGPDQALLSTSDQRTLDRLEGCRS